ncbi:flagellar hook assembly protein FlgD [Aminipila luticellarii]|uniref:flagellar hook assembly protein FlgD n=1 Tax=Aminipila luticellarii TaxID=2507160 RepID=UPI0013E89A89|nr:flagellar hook capping FlgD N-terminal domain-containing protein [Aminipila luticellarii]
MADTTINDKILSSLKALTTDKSKSTSIKANLDLQTTDWLSLLVAQLKNQDMYNQTDNTEMMSQMAQYSQIQSMQEMVSKQEDIYAMNTTSYAASLLGKEVTTASIQTTTTTTGTTDTLVTTKGTVTGVTLFEGEPKIYIDGKPFSLNQIMIVGDVATDVTPPDSDDENSGGGSTDKEETPPTDDGD